jgi:hypothetical protein
VATSAAIVGVADTSAAAAAIHAATSAAAIGGIVKIAASVLPNPARSHAAATVKMAP